MRHALAALVALLALPAWNSGDRPADRAPAIDPAQCAAVAGGGTGVATGTFAIAYLPKQLDPAAIVYLVRATPYTEWYLQARLYDNIRYLDRLKHASPMFLPKVAVTPFDPAAKSCLLWTVPDVDGHFAFTHLAPGNYYAYAFTEFRDHEEGSIPTIITYFDGRVENSADYYDYEQHGTYVDWTPVTEVTARFPVELKAYDDSRIYCQRLPRDICPGADGSDARDP